MNGQDIDPHTAHPDSTNHPEDAPLRSWPPDDATLQCPFRLFEELRQSEPVYRCPESRVGAETYVVSSFEHVTEVQTRANVFANNLAGVLPEHEAANLLRAPEPDVPTFYDENHVFFSDGEDHKVKRSWAMMLASRDRLPGYREIFEEEIDRLIDGFIEDGRCDFRAQFSESMPLSVVRRIMDLPDEIDPMVKSLSAGIAALENNPSPSPDDVDKHEAAVAELLKTMVLVIRERFAEPREGDYISDVVKVQVERDGDLDVNALARQMAMTIFGADHAMGGHLADLAARLGLEPQLQDRLGADRTLVRAFVLETLRTVTPVPWMYRHCIADTEVGGVAIPAGSLVLIAPLAGNYDPAEFPAPDSFDIDRPNLERNQLSLGRGSHRCAGAPIARLLAEVTVNRLLDRLENIRLDEELSELVPPPSYVFRVAREVHITFEKRRSTVGA
jgi:cytochrome P450